MGGVLCCRSHHSLLDDTDVLSELESLKEPNPLGEQTQIWDESSNEFIPAVARSIPRFSLDLVKLVVSFLPGPFPCDLTSWRIDTAELVEGQSGVRPPWSAGKERVVLKCLVIGDCQVGKSMFLAKVVDNVMQLEYKPTIGIDYKLSTRWVRNGYVKFQVWDISGDGRFGTLTTAYFRGVAGIIAMYNVYDALSFTHISDDWKPKIDQQHVLLLGNHYPTSPGQARQVSFKEASAFARTHGWAYMEIDPKLDNDERNGGVTWPMIALATKCLSNLNQFERVA